MEPAETNSLRRNKDNSSSNHRHNPLLRPLPMIIYSNTKFITTTNCKNCTICT